MAESPVRTRSVDQVDVLEVLSEHASTYPDASRGLTWADIAENLGVDDVWYKRRIVGLLDHAQRAGLAWRTPGPGTGRWINGGER